MPNYTEGDYVLVACEDILAGERLSLRWRGPRCILRSRNDYVYEVQDLRNGQLEEIHASRLKFYHDPYMDTQDMMSHDISSEAGMFVARMMRLEKHLYRLFVLVRWNGLRNSDDTIELLQKIFEDVPQMLERLLFRKNSPQDLIEKYRSIISL